MSETKTVGDLSQRDTSKLPKDLQHETILLHRDMGSSMRKAYQIVFRREFMPYDYKIPDGWEMHYARVEYHRTRESLMGLLFGDPCICIVVSETRNRLKEGLRCE